MALAAQGFVPSLVRPQAAPLAPVLEEGAPTRGQAVLGDPSTPRRVVPGAAAVALGVTLATRGRARRRGLRRLRRRARGGEESTAAKKATQDQKASTVEVVDIKCAKVDAAEKPLLTALLQQVESWFGEPLQNPMVLGPLAPVDREVNARGLQVLEGAIPADFPDGMYVRNGPNPRFPTTNVRVPFLGRSMHHWFEGDGMLNAVYFEGGVASFKNRYIRTEGFARDEAAGETVHRPSLMNTPPVSLFNLLANSMVNGGVKDASNTSVVFHGGKLLAIAEGASMPTEIEPEDLSTVGKYQFGEEKRLPSFTAHPHIDGKTGEMVYASYTFFDNGSDTPGTYIGVISPDSKLKHLTRVPSYDRNVLMHDCMITEQWTVLQDFPLMIDPSGLMTEEGLVKFDADATSRILLVPRYGRDAEHIFEVATGYAFHFMNAYEDGEDVVVRACRADDMTLVYPSKEDGSPDSASLLGSVFDFDATDTYKATSSVGSRLHEWRLHLKDGTVTERDLGEGHFVDFPIVNPRCKGYKHRYGWAMAHERERSVPYGFPLLGGIEKYTFQEDGSVSTQLYKLADHLAANESFFVARPGAVEEDDGWLLSYVTNLSTMSSELLIVDAKTMEPTPVARIGLPVRIPNGFHGTFITKAELEAGKRA